MSDEFRNFEDMIPDGGIPVIGLRILLYLGSDGSSKYRFGWSGDSSSVEVIGMLDLIKAELIGQFIRHKEGQ